MARENLFIKIIIFVVLFICIIAYFLFLSNNKIHTGVLYYDSGNHSYSYDFETHKKQKIVLDGYDTVSNYLPFDNGFFAIGYHFNHERDDYEDLADIIYSVNGQNTVLLKFHHQRLNLDKLTLNGNYLFIIDNQENLIAINLNNYEANVICYPIYNYVIVNDYLCYSEEAEDENNRNIYAFDCNSNDSHSIFIDIGELKNNAFNIVIYEKENQLYQYDFESKEKKIIQDTILKPENDKTTYLGSICINEEIMDIYSQWFYFSDISNRNRDYEDGVLWFLPLWQNIIIEMSSGKQYIKVNKRSHINVNVYYDGNNYYNCIYGDSNYFIRW